MSEENTKNQSTSSEKEEEVIDESKEDKQKEKSPIRPIGKMSLPDNN